MSYKIGDTVVVDDNRNVCACCVTSCCVTASNQMIVPSGNTAGRPTGATGSLYFDTDEGALMNYNGSEWAKAAGGTDPSHNCFYIPTVRATAQYGQASCFNCDMERNSCVAAYMSPNGSTSVATSVCMGTCKYGGSQTQFLTQGNKFAVRLDNPASGLTGLEKGGKGFCYMCYHLNHTGIPYAGLNDTDARATPMFSPGDISCHTLAVFWCAETNKYQGRCTCAAKGSYTYAQDLCPQNVLFRPTGPFGNSAAAFTCTCQGNFMTSDYCCGVWAGIAGDQCGCCSGAKTFLYVVFGFQPCLLYDSTSCCATADNSPIKYEAFCGNYLFRNGARLAIDYARKLVVILAQETQYPSECAAIQSYCMCDKGFPNCQSCWCLHPTSSCYIRYNCMSGIQGSAQLCGLGNTNNTTMFNTFCMITTGCNQCYYLIFPLVNSQPMCSLHMRTHSNGSPHCTFYMQLGKVFTDNDCSLRFFGGGNNMLNSYPSPACCQSGTYDFIYASGQDIKTSRPCRVGFYTQTVACCSCVYVANADFQNNAQKHFDYEPITNRVSLPIKFQGCNTCGGHITGVLVNNLSPKSVGSNQTIIPGNDINGSPGINRNICSSDCFLFTSETANTSTNATKWKVCVSCRSSTRVTCTKTLYLLDRCGVALCPGCRVFCCRGQLCKNVECCHGQNDFAIKGGVSGHFVCSYTY